MTIIIIERENYMSEKLKILYSRFKEKDLKSLKNDNIKSYLNKQDSNGNTMLYFSVDDENLEFTKNLVDIGSNPFIRNKFGMSAITLAAELDSSEILSYFIKTFSDRIDENNRSEMLANASVYGLTNNVKIMLDAGFNCNLKYRNDPITVWAMQSHSLELLKLLIDRGASINDCNEERQSLLYVASGEGIGEIVNWLLKMKADIEKASNNGCTPLIIASCFDHINIVEKLLDYGANINNVTDEGSSALLHAIDHGNKEIVEILVNRGANIYQLDKEGNGVVQYLSKIKNQKIRDEIKKIINWN